MLLQEIRLSIDQGTIRTWSYDSDGDLTHTADQWVRMAWLRPRVSGHSIIFNILTPKGVHMTKVVYAVYHGRFIEMLLSHFDTTVAKLDATPLPIAGDILT